MKAKSADVATCLNLLAQFVRDHAAAVRARGQNPETLAAGHEAVAKDVVQAEGAKQDLKSALRDATATSNGKTAGGYTHFTSSITWLRGLLGNNTPTAKQLTALRKHITDQTRNRGRRAARQSARRPAKG